MGGQVREARRDERRRGGGGTGVATRARTMNLLQSQFTATNMAMNPTQVFPSIWDSAWNMPPSSSLIAAVER